VSVLSFPLKKALSNISRTCQPPIHCQCVLPNPPPPRTTPPGTCWTTRLSASIEAPSFQLSASISPTETTHLPPLPTHTHTRHRYLLDYLAERKSYSDLSSSIIDGRYTAQKWVMAGQDTCRTCFYILEGNPADLNAFGQGEWTGVGVGGQGQGVTDCPTRDALLTLNNKMGWDSISSLGCLKLRYKSTWLIKLIQSHAVLCCAVPCCRVSPECSHEQQAAGVCDCAAPHAAA
jgi:hypothetical protein